MQPRLFLHIGVPKTGSTSIQSVLTNNRAALLERNVYYPDTQDDDRHALLVRAVGSMAQRDPSNPVFGGHEPSALLQAYLAGFAAEIRALPASVDRVIVSSERFSAYPSVEMIQRLRDFLEPLFSRIDVIVYLRRQDAHYASSYTQMLRLGDIEPPDMTRLNENHHMYDYADLLSRWAGVFGDGAMMVRLFERGTDRKFDVVEDFASACGITLPPGAVGTGQNRNPPISLAGQHALLAVGRKMQSQLGKRRVYGATWHRITVAFTKVAAGAGWQPTQDEARALVGQFAAENEAARARWFPQRASLFNDDYDSLPADPVVPNAQEAIEVLAGALLRLVTESQGIEHTLTLQKAKLAEKLGDGKKYKDLLIEALRLDPDDPETRVLLARLQMEAGDLKAARIHVDAALRVAPDGKLALRINKRLMRRETRAVRGHRKDLHIGDDDGEEDDEAA